MTISINLKKIGCILFLTGIFLLPSMLFFGGILLLLAGILSSITHKKGYFTDNWNKIFFISGILIIMSLLTHIYRPNDSYGVILDSNSSLLGSLNWLPFFWLFWAFQPYVDSKKKRKKTALILVAGTFPVLITGFGQYFFNWTGPLEILNGIIIWYQRPLSHNGLTGLFSTHNGLTGLFSNQNYAGAWLSLVWPFSIAFLIEKTNSSLKKFTAISFFLSIGLAAILTNSRNSWASILLSLPLVLTTSNLYWLLPIVFTSIVLTITSSELFTGEFQETLRAIIQNKIGLGSTQIVELSRSYIFISGLKFSFLEPIFGLGGASFPILYELQTNVWIGHPHNLFLELAISYGYPASILAFSSISLLLIKSSKLVFIKKTNDIQYYLFEKAWWTSIFILLVSQSFDVQYFDGRISIIFWLLLAGLKTIIDENIQKI